MYNFLETYISQMVCGQSFAISFLQSTICLKTLQTMCSIVAITQQLEKYSCIHQVDHLTTVTSEKHC